MVRSFECVSGVTIPYKVAERRPGDIAACYADPSFAEGEINWRATRSLDDMSADGWRWQQMNPDGYE
jgi:UDP-glucose 4-epimerase